MFVMISRILTVKEWKFNKDALVKLDKFFATAGNKISIRRRMFIEQGYANMLKEGKFQDKIEETLRGIDDIIKNWENYLKKNKS